MTVELGRKTPNAVAFVIAHLLPAAPAPVNLGSKRWAAGDPLPYWMINQVTGGTDLFSAFPVVRIHAIASTETACQQWMDLANQRMWVLIDEPNTDVLMADDSIANCEWIEMDEVARPDPPPYSSVTAVPGASAVSRLVSTYCLSLKFA